MYFPIVLVIIDPQLSHFTVKDLLNSVDEIKARGQTNINIKLNYNRHHFGIKCVSLDLRKQSTFHNTTTFTSVERVRKFHTG